MNVNEWIHRYKLLKLERSECVAHVILLLYETPCVISIKDFLPAFCHGGQMGITALKVFQYFLMFILVLRERERQRQRQSMSWGGAGREGDTESEASSRLQALSTEPMQGSYS